MGLEAVISPAVMCGFHDHQFDHKDPLRFPGSVYGLGVNTGADLDETALLSVAAKLEHFAKEVSP